MSKPVATTTMKVVSIITVVNASQDDDHERMLHPTLADAAAWLSMRSGQVVAAKQVREAAQQGATYLGVKWELASTAPKHVTAKGTPVQAATMEMVHEDKEEDQEDGDGKRPETAGQDVSTETKLRDFRHTLQDLVFCGPMRTTPDGKAHVHDFIRVVNGGEGTEPKKVWQLLQKNPMVKDLSPRISYVPNPRGGPAAPYADADTLMSILVQMDGPRAKAFRSKVAPVLRAFLRGDPAVAVVAEENRRFMEEVPVDSAFAQLLRDETAGLSIGSKSPALNLKLTSPRHADNDNISAFHGQVCVYLIRFWVILKGNRYCLIKYGRTEDCKERFQVHLRLLPRIGLKDSEPEEGVTADDSNLEVYTLIPTGTKEVAVQLENHIRSAYAKHRIGGLWNASRKSEVIEVLEGPPGLDIAAVEAKALAFMKLVEERLDKERAEKELLDDRKFQLQLEDKRLRMKELELEMLRARA